MSVEGDMTVSFQITINMVLQASSLSAFDRGCDVFNGDCSPYV